MKKNITIWQLSGLTFATALGTILHFLYGWIPSAVVAPFAAVNESTWEHMKILFFPMLIFACIQSFYFKSPSFWWIKLIGILIGVGGIPVLFYTFNGCFGKSPDWLNVLFFFLSAGLGFFVETLLFYRNFSLKHAFIAVGLLIIASLSFAFFTFFPPVFPLFQDPLTQGYGITTYYHTNNPMHYFS